MPALWLKTKKNRNKMAVSQPSQQKLICICMTLIYALVLNVKEIGSDMAELWLKTQKKSQQNGHQAAILDHITTKIDMQLYDSDLSPCNHIERNHRIHA